MEEKKSRNCLKLRMLLGTSCIPCFQNPSCYFCSVMALKFTDASAHSFLFSTSGHITFTVYCLKNTSGMHPVYWSSLIFKLKNIMDLEGNKPSGGQLSLSLFLCVAQQIYLNIFRIKGDSSEPLSDVIINFLPTHT